MEEKYINIDKFDLSFSINGKEELIAKDIKSSKLVKVGDSPIVTGIQTGKIKCYLQQGIKEYKYDIKLNDGVKYPISLVVYNIKKPLLHKEDVHVIGITDILGKCEIKIESDGNVRQTISNGIVEEPMVEFDYYVLI